MSSSDDFLIFQKELPAWLCTSTASINAKELWGCAIGVIITILFFIPTKRRIRINVYIDNLAAVCSINKQSSSQANLMIIARGLYQILREREIVLTAFHIPGFLNLASDAASRRNLENKLDRGLVLEAENLLIKQMTNSLEFILGTYLSTPEILLLPRNNFQNSAHFSQDILRAAASRFEALQFSMGRRDAVQNSEAFIDELWEKYEQIPIVLLTTEQHQAAEQSFTTAISRWLFRLPPLQELSKNASSISNASQTFSTRNNNQICRISGNEQLGNESNRDKFLSLHQASFGNQFHICFTPRQYQEAKPQRHSNWREPRAFHSASEQQNWQGTNGSFCLEGYPVLSAGYSENLEIQRSSSMPEYGNNQQSYVDQSYLPVQPTQYPSGQLYERFANYGLQYRNHSETWMLGEQRDSLEILRQA